MKTCSNLSLLFLLLSATPSPVIAAAEPSADRFQLIRLAVNEDLPTLDPHHHLTIIGNAALCNIYEALVCRSREGEPIPCLADRWESSDAQTWRFFLRSGVRFHDGTPVSVDDVVFSLERARSDPQSKVAAFLAGVDSIVGDHAVRQIVIVTRQPDTHFLDGLSMISVVPANSPAKIVEPVGTGPYRFVSYKQNSGLRLERFADYWNGATSVAAAEFVVVPDVDEAVGLLEAGKVDLVTYLPGRFAARVQDNADLWVESRLSQSVVYLQLNYRIPPFDNSRVREAIDLAIDREALVQDITLNHARPASQILGPEILGHDPHQKATRRDLKRARQLLEEPRAGKPIPLKIQTTAAFLEHADAIAAMLEEVGLRVDVVARPWPELYSDMQAGTVGAWLGVWSFDSPDGAVYFNVAAHSPTKDGMLGSASMTGLRDPELDAMIRDASAESDPLGRNAKLREISRRWTALRLEIPLLWPMDLYGTRRKLEWEAHKDQSLQIREMSWQR